MLRLSIIQSTFLLNRQTYPTTTKQTTGYSLRVLFVTLVVGAPSVIPLQCEVTPFGHTRSRHLTSFKKTITLTVYIVRCALAYCVAQNLAWLCNNQFNLSLAVSVLCGCLMHGSISCIALHQSTFPVLRALCCCLLHGSISSMALHQSAYSIPCSACVVRLLNAWLNILHGCVPINFSPCSACTVHLLTA